MDEKTLEDIRKAIEDIKEIAKEIIKNICERLRDFFEYIGEIIGDLVEKLKDDFYKIPKKPKYKLVKSLVKPYRQPYIKITARARRNI